MPYISLLKQHITLSKENPNLCFHLSFLIIKIYMALMISKAHLYALYV